MLAHQVNDNDADFPIEQDVYLPMTRKGWRHIGPNWVSYERPIYDKRGRTGSGIPLKKRMRTLAQCAVCHVGTLVLYDYYGRKQRKLIDLMCKDCHGTYERSIHSSLYQQRIDDMPIPYANMAVYQEHRRSEPTGEQRLAAALIASAATDLWRSNKYHGKDKDRAETKEWLQGAKARVTFLWCCEALGIDPQWARHMIYASRARYEKSQESKRPYSGYAHQPVEEYVPDVDGSERSQPARKRLPLPILQLPLV